MAVAAAAAILEAGVVMAMVRWSRPPTTSSPLSSSRSRLYRAARRGRGADPAQPARLAGRTGPAAGARARPAGVAGRGDRTGPHRRRDDDVVSHNVQVMVTLADAASLAQASDPTRVAEAIHEVSSTAARRSPTCGGCWASWGRIGSVPPACPVRRSRRPCPGWAVAPGPRWHPSRACVINALAERVRATGLDVSVRRVGTPFEVSEAAGLPSTAWCRRP